MPGNFKHNDLRVIKTYKAILSALSALLNRQKFSKITVNDLCEQAQLSRTAFYMHFLDKYDLLKYFLSKYKKDYQCHLYDIETVNSHLTKNRKLIINLVEDADYITMAILQDFVLSAANFPSGEYAEHSGNKNIVLASFCAGGIINCMLWQIKKGFPSSLPMANSHLEEILQLLRRWSNK